MEKATPKTVRHYPIDRTPRENPNRQRDARAPFTPENCEGYNQNEMTALNTEFSARWNAGEWPTFDEARIAFQDEVVTR